MSWISRIASIVFLLAILAINWQPDRTNFIFLATTYSLAFVTYITLIKRKEIGFKQLAIIALLAQLCSVIFLPHLSIDYSRFLWDGEMTWMGINPFDFKPTEVIQQPFLRHNAYLHSVYEGIGHLSQRNYSCYPTINQGYFILATAFSSSIVFNTLVLKLLIVGTELFGAFYLYKLLDFLKLPTDRMWLLYLNPLWIIECTGNVHFEGVMISFLFVALYYILQKKIVLGGAFFSLAVQIKLIPLMLLPFFYRFLGLGKSILFYSLTISLVFIIALVHIDTTNFWNFNESLILYFKVFEFNSFVFYNYLQYGKMVYGWNPIRIYGPRLSQIALGIILTLALYGELRDWRKIFNRMTMAFFVYLLLSSTVHPWYILPMLALSLFTNFSFAIIWSFLIFFTYFFYTMNQGSAFEVRLLINIEYAVLLLIFVFEVIKKRPLLGHSFAIETKG